MSPCAMVLIVHGPTLGRILKSRLIALSSLAPELKSTASALTVHVTLEPDTYPVLGVKLTMRQFTHTPLNNTHSGFHEIVPVLIAF